MPLFRVLASGAMLAGLACVLAAVWSAGLDFSTEVGVTGVIALFVGFVAALIGWEI